jgi:flagellar motor switch protein FliM
MSQVAASLGEKFVHFYGTESNVSPVSITEHFAGDLVGQAELERSFCVALGPDAKHACGFLTVDVETALSWVTLLLGDSETENDPDRALSPLEESLLSDVVVAIGDTFVSSLRPQVEFVLGAGITKGPPAVSYEATDEICVVVFEVKKADAHEASRMRFVLPSRALAALVGKPAERTSKLPPDEIERIMMEHLQQMPVTVTTKLSSTWLSFEEVLDLNQNDIILLDTRIDEPVELIVDDQTIFQGRPAQTGGRYAVLVTACTANPPRSPSKSPRTK